MKPIRVLLVDDNLTFLHIATGFVQQQKELVLVGTAQGGEEALARAPIMRPQVVLLDLVMPGLSGFEIIPRLREVLPKAGVIMLSLFDSDGYRKAALAAGADDFVSKRSVAGDLMPAIRRVAQARKANGPT